jgi:mRNA interferase MazF
LRRGDIVSIVGRGDFATRPRPALVVQADVFNEHHPAVTVCPITSHLTGDALFRVPIDAGGGTGLNEDSEIEIDRVQAIWRQRVGRPIGRASDVAMELVDQALRRWLEL